MSKDGTGERQGYGGEQSGSEHRLGLSRIYNSVVVLAGGRPARRCFRYFGTRCS
jgi:hypothetical protein